MNPDPARDEDDYLAKGTIEAFNRQRLDGEPDSDEVQLEPEIDPDEIEHDDGPGDDLHDDLAGDEKGAEYGQPGPDPWLTSQMWDGRGPVQLRRPEMTGDSHDALVEDLTRWVEWLVPTFRIHTKVPPCWILHPALVEELLALFFHWQNAWLPAEDNTMPISFLREFDLSLSRIENRWKPPCDQFAHKEPAAINFASSGIPQWRPWWSNPAFNDDEGALVAVEPHSQMPT